MNPTMQIVATEMLTDLATAPVKTGAADTVIQATGTGNTVWPVLIYIWFFLSMSVACVGICYSIYISEKEDK